jgi:CHAP domain
VLLQSFRQRKQFNSPPAPGDVFFCGATGGDHTGLVESVKPDGRTFATIEGNASAGAATTAPKSFAGPERSAMDASSASVVLALPSQPCQYVMEALGDVPAQGRL